LYPSISFHWFWHIILTGLGTCCHSMFPIVKGTLKGKSFLCKYENCFYKWKECSHLEEMNWYIGLTILTFNSAHKSSVPLFLISVYIAVMRYSHRFVQLWSCFLKRKKQTDYRIYFSVRKMSNLRLFNKCRHHTLCTLDTVTEVLEKIERKMKDEHIITIS